MLTVAMAVGVVMGAAGCAVSEDAVSDVEAKASVVAQQVEQSGSAVVAKVREVDWSKYPDELKTRIDDFAAKDNCSGLNRELDQMDPNEDAALTEYLKAAASKAGCA